MNRGGKMLNRGGKYLRPPPDIESSDPEESSEEEDSEDDDEEEEDDTAEPSSSKVGNTAPPAPNANLSSSESDDDDDDDDDEEEDADDNDDEEDDPPSTNKRPRSTSDSSSSVSPPPTTKPKQKHTTPSTKPPTKSTSTSNSKNNKASFFDEEAEASDDEEGEDDEPYGTHHDPHDRVKKHYTKEDIARENESEELRQIIAEQNARRAQQRRLGDTSDAAEIAERIEQRHKHSNRRVDYRSLDQMGSQGGSGGVGLTEVTQQSLLPSVSDPRMWMFSCSNGKEADMVYQIMNKCIAMAARNKPLGITAAVAGSGKGKVYVESTSEPSVLEAIHGIRGLLAYTKVLVPIKDMTTVLKVKSKKKPVNKNDWVRMTRGHYKGDLALVRKVLDNGLKCIIQCVPRLDLTLSELPEEEARIRRRTVKPPQKFFNKQEIAAMYSGDSMLLERMERRNFKTMDDLVCDFFEGNYYNDGYLLKEVTVGTLVKECGEDNPPTLDELQKFRNSGKGGRDGNGSDSDSDGNEGAKRAKSLLDEIEKISSVSGGLSKKAGGLIIGDTVEIVEGDLVGMRGNLLSIDGSTVKVKPTNADDLVGTTEVEFLISQVRKHIEIGAHVKVTSGRYANETGVVVAVTELEGENDCEVQVLTDITNQERSVRMSQLQESAEIAAGQKSCYGFELHDLVILSGGGTNEVGVIVRVGREDFTVINNNGVVREVRQEEVRGKRNSTSGRAVALDAQANQIRVGDTVKVVEGAHKGKSATIKRMNRTQLFLFSQTFMDHAGIFVVRSRSCVLAGSGMQSQNQAGGNALMYNAQQNNGHGGGGGPGGGRGRKEDGLSGKTVRICSGNWKGYIGTVCDTTPTHVQVELHTRLKKVMVLRDRVVVAGDKFGATEDPGRPNSNPIVVATTPFIGGATPMHGGTTPMHGGATPMHDMGGFTPAHNPGGDDVWRPGGNIDRQPEDEETNGTMDASTGWGSTAESTPQPSDGFGSPTGDTGGGWGSSNDQSGGGTWTPDNNGFDGAKTQDAPPSSTSASGDTTATSEVQGLGTNSSNITGDIAVGGPEENEEAPTWFMERVCVTLNSNDAPAVIKEVNNNMAVVELEDKSRITVSHRDVTMTAPKEHDMVLVIGGAEVGVESELVCVDGDTDAILKDSTEEFKIVNIAHLVKIISDP